MKEMVELKNFVFRGMLLRNSLENLYDVGINLSLKDDDKDNIDDRINLEDFSLNTRISAIQMAQVYIAFYCFENAVRELVSSRLKENLGSNWWANIVQAKIKDKVERRKQSESKHKYHSPRSAENISYTDFGDLAHIITNRWPDFEDLFPDQDWVMSRFNELEKSRNVIAHNNLLTERDITRIKLYLEDWLRQVG